MQVKSWAKIGKPEILAVGYGDKVFLRQKYQEPQTGKSEDFLLFKNKKPSVIILPLTARHEVVAIRQFRPGAGKVIIEIPGGNYNPGEKNASLKKVATRELLEETGFTAKRLIRLTPKSIWFEPAIMTAKYFPFLALDCVKKTEQKLDSSECIGVELYDLKVWMSMISEGIITDGKTITTTLLSLTRLE